MAQNFIDATGLPVAIPNYRLTSGDLALVNDESVKHPTHAQDIVLALSAIKSSEELNTIADTNNIYLVGHSCGCHLVATVMLDPPTGEGVPFSTPLPSDVQESIKGIALVAGLYDLDTLADSRDGYRDWIAAAMPKTSDGSFTQFSVDRYTVRNGSAIPWLIVHSAGDTAVDEIQADRMVQHLQAEYERLGYDKSLIRKDNTDLGDHIPLLNNAAFAKLAATII